MELPLFSLCFLLSISFIAHATVPPSATFKYVNEGEFGEYISEYFPDYRPLPISTSPFQLIFYNTTPNAYTLALRMGTVRSESTMRWVWEANRGNPVRENATLTLVGDGNLVLADADGRVAWQTNTANKGVVGLQLLSNGNMVLHDSKGKFIWQSFDSPTDTLLVGQSLRVGGVTRLVSRASETHNSDGAYSLVMEPKRLAMYYKSPNSPKPYIYYAFDSVYKGRLQNATLNCAPNGYDEVANDLTLDLSTGNGLTLARPKYNSTLSFLRIGIDGSLKIYTYNNKVDYQAWEVTYTLFSRDGFPEGECQLPERCGKFGLCEDSQCVACPLPSGLMGWSKDCEPVKPPACGSKNFYYYKLEGVDHSMSKYASGSGAMKEDDCGKKCSSDCKCLGYFYNKDTSKCWIAYDLQTLTKVANSTHVGYIKAPKH
ncbi:PREDICTED: epidermis-specific secreted glycoprotein EP1-like [Populus euphratica]|uniref:Epidermis-specific secreted glycoprotein EP1-like n=1 Tax=Populus euphratica TaxID=75702 RepID=A0AAJ6XSF4_POPEU|nr:PREDICTED: epidermis-specific secreted glycoprotein EP1-like [Populus euphratica]